MSIAEMFAERLEELKRIDEQSQRKTQDTLKRIRKLIAETEEIHEALTNLESEI
jgi:NTP pyrophosphatase (non-canonical NTP hydrolase)